MSNALGNPATPNVRELIAANLDAELTRQRWTKRKAAGALGIAPDGTPTRYGMLGQLPGAAARGTSMVKVTSPHYPAWVDAA